MEEVILKSKFFKVKFHVHHKGNSIVSQPLSSLDIRSLIFFLVLYQAQKARDKEENEQLMDELDKSFSSLVQSKALLSLTEPGKMNALKALVNKSIPDEHLKKEELAVTQKAETNNQVPSYGSTWVSV